MRLTKAFFKASGQRGGKKRAANMTPEQRQDAARAAVQARWKQHRERRDREPEPVTS